MMFSQSSLMLVDVSKTSAAVISGFSARHVNVFPSSTDVSSSSSLEDVTRPFADVWRVMLRKKFQLIMKITFFILKFLNVLYQNL